MNAKDYRALLERLEPWIPTRGESPAEDQELAQLNIEIRNALRGGTA